MNKTSKILIQKYFQENSIIRSNIGSFNNFVEFELQKIIDENKEVEPTIIPPNVDTYKIRFDRIWIEEPTIIEADGSKRNIFPSEARLRKMTYAAPIFVDVSAHINGQKRESVNKAQIGNLPIMLRSKYCHLNKLDRDGLIEKGEDPDDPGGYFIINGSEKVLVNIEDLAANRFLVEKTKTGPSEYVGKLFSERGSFKIPHTIERMKDGIIYLSFTRIKRIPIVIAIKALGLMKDEEIMRAVSEDNYDEMFINLYECVDIKTQEDAIDYIAKKSGITQSKEVRIERTQEIIDKYLMPHISIDKKDRLQKAHNLCKLIKKFILVSRGEMNVDDKDHYMNKKIKMSGDLLADLIRVNFSILVNDLLYNFQRIVKRGKFPSVKVIIREKLLTSRIYSSMATGHWVGGRKGVSQRIQRLNFLDMMSHLQRVVSPLSATQENFEARELHSTHLGRLCPVETPEGTNIGLKKNLALLSNISPTPSIKEEETIKSLKGFGLKVLK
ncbi:DNA-directed RNA polymerase subunit B'' [Candidatus Woesearchaeota archaeon]|nr:DNA-directed RNA polymerase subunit B'' [Candidatus Woesearchaeota archaeon]MBU3941365.1 DNA-directed RNA polymerase subunit B'' [Nanoarchaeota archaeon]